MKKYFWFLLFILMGSISIAGNNQSDLPKSFLINHHDTVYLDLPSAVISSGYIDIPVYIKAFDTIHSLDFLLKYDHSNLKFDSIIKHVTYLHGVNYYENPSDSTLRLTSYSPTIMYDNYISIVSIRFEMISGINNLYDLFKNFVAYLNGDLVGTRVINATMFTSISYINPSCIGTSDGSINLSVFGGNPPYTYIWSNSDTTSSIQNLQAGTYHVTITDQQGYIKVDSVVLSDPSLLFQTENPTCSTLDDGDIFLTVIGGIAPYQYAWSNSDTTKDIHFLAAGIYSVTVTDSTGCVLTGSQQLMDSLVIVVSNNLTSPLCPGSPNGNILLNVSGGSPPYFYAWSNSANSNIIDSLVSGNYSVTVTDHLGCMHTENYHLPDPPALMILLKTINLSCASINDGEIKLFVSGGSPPYNYSWSNAETTQNIDSLMPGNYTVTVSDMKGCSIIDSAIIDNSAAIILNINKKDVSCYNLNDGYIQLSVLNGVPPFSFNWSNGETEQSINNLSPRLYIVTVSQTNQCQKIDSVKIDGASEIKIDLQKNDLLCSSNNDGSVIALVQGGYAPYSYKWSNMEQRDNTILNLKNGVYTLTVTDANNCIAVNSVELKSLGQNCIDIYSAFSPNGDGKNDVWNIGNIEMYSGCSLKIFNQWGEIIFSSIGYNKPWDGTYKGSLLPSAAYYYIIDLGNGEKYSGSVCILK